MAAAFLPEAGQGVFGREITADVSKHFIFAFAGEVQLRYDLIQSRLFFWRHVHVFVLIGWGIPIVAPGP